MAEFRVPVEVHHAFSKRPDLEAKIQKVFDNSSKSNHTPSGFENHCLLLYRTEGDGCSFYASSVISSIAEYVSELRRLVEGEDSASGPVVKKRKLNDGAPVQENGARGSINGAWTADRFEGISFSVPQRKKLNLDISLNKKKEGIRAIAAGATDPEFGIPWSEVEHVICLPVPEKAQAQKNFCVFPKGGDGVTSTLEGGTQYETIVWTAPDTKAKGAAEDEPTQARKILTSLRNAKCVPQEPDEKEFASEIPQPGRKGEKAYHVKAFKGSKDGKHPHSPSHSPHPPNR